MLLNVAFEEVQWRVIAVEKSVLDVLFQRDLELSTGVALSNLVKRVAKSLNQALQKNNLNKLCQLTCLTYLKLPLGLTTPCFSDTCDDARSVALLVPLYEFFDCQLVSVHTFNSISECLRVVHLEQIVLTAPIAIGRPLPQEQAAAVL